MNNAEIYASLTDFSSIAKWSLNICIYVIITNALIYILKFLFKKDKNSLILSQIKNMVKKNGIIDVIGAFTSIVLAVAIMFSTFYFIKYSIVIKFLGISATLIIIYIIYIKPFISSKQEPFKFNYVEYGVFLTISLFIISKVNYLEAFKQMNSEGSAQVVVIIMCLIQTYITIYCLLVNIYLLLKNLSELSFNKLDGFIKKIFNYFNKNITSESIQLSYKHSNNLLNKSNKYKFWLLIIPFFIYDTLLCIMKFLKSIIFSLIFEQIYNILTGCISILSKISKTNENQINYGISKITSVIAFIFTYMLIQFYNKEANSIFQPRIISTYEFISTAILIPIILDGLLSIKDKLKLDNHIIKINPK